jgi:hypothetical protein
MRGIPSCVVLLTLAGCAGFAQAQPMRSVIAPVVRSGFTRLTPYDTLQAFLASVSGSPHVAVETVATTRQGRKVIACVFRAPVRPGGDPRRLKVLLFAQQHGNESSGKEAMTMLLAGLASGDMDPLLERCDVAVVPQMNPDGAELRQRRTSDSIDLNRTHLVLSSPETRGLHDFFDRWRPDVTLDVHEFQPYGREWEHAGLVKTVDVQFGMLTNINSPKPISDYQRRSVYPRVAEAMEKQGYRFHEYLVGDPKEGARFSTTEINDGRQSFGILGTMSFIQEGRNGRTPEENLERRVRSQLASIQAFVGACASEGPAIQAMVRGERERLSSLPPTEQVALFMDHYPGSRTLAVPAVTLPGGQDTSWTVTPLRDSVASTLSVMVPRGYVVPRELGAVREILDRNRVEYTVAIGPMKREVTRFEIDSVRVETWEEEEHERPVLRAQRCTLELREGDLIVPTGQLRSKLIVTMLEPDSMWGLVKYPQFRFLLTKGTYPISRF